MTINLGKLIEAARQVVRAFDESRGGYDECNWQRFCDAGDVQPLRDALGEGDEDANG